MPNQAPTQNPPFNSQQGSGFVNLSQFLNANQGNKLGSTVGGAISGAAQGVNNGLGTANQAFQKDIQANTLNTSNNQQQATNIINQASNLDQNQGLGASDTSAFERLTAGGYNGPTGLNNATQLQNQAQQAQQYGQAAGNPYGRLGLLKNLVGNNTYTQGEASLDNMLLGNAPQLQQAQRETRGLTGNVNRAVNVAGQQAANTSQANKQFGQNVLGQAQTAYGNYGTGLTNQAQQDLTNQNALYQSDVNALNNKQVINGITPGTATYNVNPLQYLNQYDPNQVNAANVANGADVARLNALANLAQTQNNVASQVSQNQYNPATAVNFDTSGFNNAINGPNGNAQAYQQALANTNINMPVNRTGVNLAAPSEQNNIMTALPILQQQVANISQYSRYPQYQQDIINSYQQALAQYNALQTQYGANNYLGGAPSTPSRFVGGGAAPSPYQPGFAIPKT